MFCSVALHMVFLNGKLRLRIASAYRYPLTHSRTGFPEQEVCLSLNVYVFVYFSVHFSVYAGAS